MGRNCESKPHFFKILLGDFSQRLRIPPDFMKHITEKASKNAILEGPTGSIWDVKLEKALNGTFFQIGWPEFVNDHALQAAEFLVFRYNGNLHFTVQIFGVNACEREDFFTIKSSKKCYKRKRRQGNVSKKLLQKNGKDGAEGRIKVEPDSSDSDERVAFQSRNFTVEPGTSISPLVKCQHVLSLESNGSQQMKMGTPSTSSCRARSYRTGFMSTRRPVTKGEKAMAWTAAHSLKPKHPHFKKAMTKSNVYGTLILHIPREFCQRYLPKVKSKMTIRDPRGMAWKVIYTVHLGEHGNITAAMIAGGWPSLCFGNNLEEGDVCVFELVKKHQMHMHIFRVVQELTPLIKISV